MLNVRLVDGFDCDGNIGELVSCKGNPTEASLINALTHIILSLRIPVEALSFQYYSMPVV